MYFSCFKKVESSTKTMENGFTSGSTDTAINYSSHLPFTMTENPNELTNLSSGTGTSVVTSTTSSTSFTSIDNGTARVKTKDEVTLTSVTADVSTTSPSVQTTSMKGTHMTVRTSSSSKFEATNSFPDLTSRTTKQTQSEANTAISMSTHRHENVASTMTSYPLNSNSQSASRRGIQNDG